MNRFFLNASFGALALAAPLFSASNAFAGTTCHTSRGDVTIKDISTCHFDVSGGCSAQCTPVEFTATCSATCTNMPVTTCTNTCETKCSTSCTTAPTTFSCKDYCTTDCTASCMASCTGDGCTASCSASCDTQCTQRCTAHPGKTDCTTECGDSCTASCTVEANIKCDTDCTAALTGGCTTKCSDPQGALFCDNQYIDISSVSDCDFTLDVSASGTIKAGCSAAPGGSSPFGLPAGLAAMAGLGLLVARRRRRQI